MLASELETVSNLTLPGKGNVLVLAMNLLL
jgi:hypothetical protein